MSGLLDRRTILRGAGTMMALPWLEAMVPLTASAASPKVIPVRMAFLFVPNGIDMAGWTPAQVGRGYALPPILQAMGPVRDQISVITGLAQMKAFANGDGPGDHARSSATWLTGVQARKTAGSDLRVGVSVDQIAARAIGRQTRFPSLEIGCERGAVNGDCDSGYSCAYSSNIAWSSETTPVAKDVSPRAVFERLFGAHAGGMDAQAKARRAQYNASILDYVSEDAESLRRQLGRRDQQKLDEYFSAVREVEARLEAAERDTKDLLLAGIPTTPGQPRDRGEHIRLLGDMMVLAFQADLTRVATFMFANEGSNRPYREIDVHEGHHDISHHGRAEDKMAKKRQIDTYHAEQLAYIVQKMASIKEVEGTLLDNSMILYGGGISDGDRHNHDDLPLLMAGRAGGKIPTGQHFVFPKHTPMTNLFLTMLDRVGVNVDRLGDSTGKLQGLW